MTSPKSVFVSYASQDAEAALRLCEALRAGGVSVWFDQAELRGGDAWDREIRQQILDCAIFIPIVSSSTQQRLEGYFRREWKLAADRTHDMSERMAFLVPVVIDGTSDAEADVPDVFRRTQWTRLPAGAATQAFVDRIVDLLSPAPRFSGSTGSSHRATRGSPSRIARLAVLLATLAALGTVGYMVVERRSASAPPLAQAPAAGATTEKSIAVLPFVDMSEKKDQEYFSDGLSEELIDHLTHSPDLKVISRTSSFQFKGKSEDARAIAAKLGVANLLEGSVRKVANRLRITVQLVRAVDGAHLWSQTFDRDLDDIFKVQDEISTTVANALNATLVGARRTDGPEIADPEAYNLILKGKYFYNRSNEGDLARAAALFKEAIDRDPKSSLAWSYLASVYVFQGFSREIPNAEARNKAFESVHEALKLDPSSAKAHRRLGNILSAYNWDWDAAALEYERAAALDPFGEDGRYAKEERLGITQMRTGKSAELLEMAAMEVRLNPLDSASLGYLAAIQFQQGLANDSALTYRTLLDLNPGFEQARASYAMVLMFLGKNSEALAEAGKAGDSSSKLRATACILWALGQRRDADASLRTLEERFAHDEPYEIAKVHACRQEADAAFDWLERAVTQRDSDVSNLNIDPEFANFRSDPRFNVLLHKIRILE
jgi:TolB-like protein/Tfp pilus assembly protein PilF